MSNPSTPIQKFSAPTGVSAGNELDFSAIGTMGSLYMFNAGAVDVYYKFDGVPVAADGNGQTLLPANGGFCNLNGINFVKVGLITAGAAGRVFAIATESQGGSGQGMS